MSIAHYSLDLTQLRKINEKSKLRSLYGDFFLLEKNEDEATTAKKTQFSPSYQM